MTIFFFEIRKDIPWLSRSKPMSSSKCTTDLSERWRADRHIFALETNSLDCFMNEGGLEDGDRERDCYFVENAKPNISLIMRMPSH